MSPRSDVVILGAGVIGLSLALELRMRGHRVAVQDGRTPMAQASSAAAGMLAVEDPHNPPELSALARLSASLYPEFLSRIEALAHLAIPFQTQTTWQTMPGGEVRCLAEHSIDPRQLAPALLKAAEAAGVQLEHALIDNSKPISDANSAHSGAIVYTTGAWSLPAIPVFPRKGQMLRVRLPSRFTLQEVYRSERAYIVPRTRGPQAGTALIGATVEDAGFDLSVSYTALSELRSAAATLVPEIADEQHAPTVEAWAGLRPATHDGLPILGRYHDSNGVESTTPRYLATGHFRNGILLAPATAVTMADLMEGRPPRLDLQPFSAARFSSASPSPILLSTKPDDIRSSRRDNRFGNLT